MVCGGLCAAAPPPLDENLEDIFENQDPRRPGDVPGEDPVLSVELLRPKLGRVGICLGGVAIREAGAESRL